MSVSLYFKESKYGYFCLIEDDLISNYINAYGYWEEHLFSLYSQIIKEDFIIIDGGANLGFHTVQFGKLASKGKIYSFEPQNLIYNVLSTNILVNNLSNTVEQFKLGLSDCESIEIFTSVENPSITMGEFCINWGGRGFTEKDGNEKAKTTTIDSFNIDKLDFIKLDIQGFEYKALMGGIKTIKNNMPTIFVENYDGRCDEKIKEQERAPIDLLLDLGYKGYRMLIGNSDDCIFTINPEVMDLVENKNKVNFEIIK